MPVEPLNIFSSFDVQRFDQFGSMDCANWYQLNGSRTKKPQALYPSMGRKHVESFGQNKLTFNAEPKQVFRTINYMYVIDGTQVKQVDRFLNEVVLGTIPLGSQPWFDYLVVGGVTYGLLTTGTNMYVIVEQTGSTLFSLVTDPNAPPNPQYVATFGERFIVSEKDTPTYYLSQINFGGNYNPGTTESTAFTISGSSLVNRASGIIRQLAVLHAQLYIFSDFDADIWANIPSQFTVAGVTTEFPWKLNTSYSFNIGMKDPFSLSVGFNRMVWLGQNINGLISFMVSDGGMPKEISTEAVDVLLENSRENDGDDLSSFITGPTNGFLYQWENTVFYRVSAGNYQDFKEVDKDFDANCIEFNFSTGTWSRCIELNGERNRSVKHVFFANRNLITVQGDNAMYELSGNVYRNEIRDTTKDFQNADAFKKFPLRYELVTEPFYAEDYSEFITDYVEIDFVFGKDTFYKCKAPFDNTTFIISEDSDPDGLPIYHITEDQENGEDVFIITEDGNTPGFSDNHYNDLFKPHISLYWSDDGGITYYSADLREFSRLGQYRYQMRWYELGPSRNRKYKLICVSSSPIVVLGAVHNIRRASGGGN